MPLKKETKPNYLYMYLLNLSGPDVTQGQFLSEVKLV